MPPVRKLPPGYTVYYPNREKAASKVMKVIVILILLASVVLMLALTFGGWSKFQGLKVVNFIWCALYVICAFYVARWKRGVLPIAAALAILLLMVAVTAGTGLAGTSWFDRKHIGFGQPQSIFSGKGFSPDLLGTLTVILIPVEALLIAVCLLAFAQGWNIEQEIKEEELQRRRRGSSARPQQPATA